MVTNRWWWRSIVFQSLNKARPQLIARNPWIICSWYELYDLLTLLVVTYKTLKSSSRTLPPPTYINFTSKQPTTSRRGDCNPFADTAQITMTGGARQQLAGTANELKGVWGRYTVKRGNGSGEVENDILIHR